MKQALSNLLANLLARLGGTATRALWARVDELDEHLDARFDSLADPIEAMSARLEAVETSLGILHRAVEDLAAIPALSTELVDGIAEAEARAAARLVEVERLLAGR